MCRLSLLLVFLGLAAGNIYGKLPPSFEPNQGQTDAWVKFLSRASGYTLFVTAEEAVFAGLDGSVEQMKLIGAKRNMRMEPLDKQPGISNYFIDNDPSKWRTNVPNYGRVALRGVYPGIDLIFYGNEGQLEYDWVVAPGADPKQIRVKWEGPSQVTKNSSGDLVLSASLVQHKPVILQEGKRVEGGYAARGREVAFELAKYDAAKPLVIDPVLVYSTYLGDGDANIGFGVAVDRAGNAYVTGYTHSTNFPIANPLRASCSPNFGFCDGDAFVTKINAAGSALLYSTHLGGSLNDRGLGMAVDGSGNAYVTGQTTSTDFPTSNPIQSSFGGNSFRGAGFADAFVTTINAAGLALVFSTYLGGNGNDGGQGIAVDGGGNAYVTGFTNSTNFPTANPIQGNFGGINDAFVFSISAPIQVSSATHFIPVTPCRIVDTRSANGAFGGPAIAGNTSRDFVIPNSACGIPPNAAAYSMNVAVVPSGPLGFLTLWPTGQPQPLVATLNSDGRIKSNAAIVAAGVNGAISVFATDTTDVILDINGYFVSGNNPAALAFYPVTPCRFTDTRNPNPVGGPSLAAQSTRSFPILAGACGMPETAQAYSLNFAAVPKGPTLGYMTAWPDGQPQPLVASLNDPTGTVLANAVVVPAGANTGAVNVFTTDATDLVIDINGYFDSQGPGGLSFYTVTPCRVLDTRLPAGAPPFSTTSDVNVTASPCRIPATAQAFVFNATVVPPGPLGFITMWPQGQTQPLASTLNAYDGAITNNMAIVPTTTGSISVFPSAPTHLVLDIFGYFAP